MRHCVVDDEPHQPHAFAGEFEDRGADNGLVIGVRSEEGGGSGDENSLDDERNRVLIIGPYGVGVCRGLVCGLARSREEAGELRRIL